MKAGPHDQVVAAQDRIDLFLSQQKARAARPAS